MSRYVGAGVIELWYVSTVADPLVPTFSELNAGIDLTGFLTDGGLSTPFDGNIVDGADMGSKFNKTIPGTFGGNPITAEFFRDSVKASDTAWTTLPRATAGFYAVAPRGLVAAGVWAVGDDVDLWTIEVVTRNPADWARNEAARFTVESAVTEVPLEDFAIAA